MSADFLYGWIFGVITETLMAYFFFRKFK